MDQKMVPIAITRPRATAELIDSESHSLGEYAAYRLYAEVVELCDPESASATGTESYE